MFQPCKRNLFLDNNSAFQLHNFILADSLRVIHTWQRNTARCRVADNARLENAGDENASHESATACGAVKKWPAKIKSKWAWWTRELNESHLFYAAMLFSVAFAWQRWRCEYRLINMSRADNCFAWDDWKWGSGKCDTDRIARAENAGVKNAGVDRTGGKCRRKLYGTPNRDYIEKILRY